MLGRRAFVASSLLAGCSVRSPERDAPAPLAPAPTPPPLPPPEPTPPIYALFDAYPALEDKVPRVAIGTYPAAVERATTFPLFIKRDDLLSARFGGGKVRKLELLIGEARALGKRTLITSGGVGSNQAVAVAVLGEALGFSVRLHLAPQPASSLVQDNLGADAATHATMKRFDTVWEAHAAALQDAARDRDVYVIPPGGTVPLGTLGFVNAGLELAADVRAARLPAPKRVYIALGLGGTAAGLAIGCALGGLDTEIVAVRASSPGSVTEATLRTIHEETMAFLRARVPNISPIKPNLRIEGRFVGAGYGVPTPAGRGALARARDAEGWQLDPVYTAKALAAALDDHDDGPHLFWNTMSSRPIARAEVPASFRRFL